MTTTSSHDVLRTRLCATSQCDRDAEHSSDWCAYHAHQERRRVRLLRAVPADTPRPELEAELSLIYREHDALLQLRLRAAARSLELLERADRINSILAKGTP